MTAVRKFAYAGRDRADDSGIGKPPWVGHMIVEREGTLQDWQTRSVKGIPRWSRPNVDLEVEGLSGRKADNMHSATEKQDHNCE